MIRSDKTDKWNKMSKDTLDKFLHDNITNDNKNYPQQWNRNDKQKSGCVCKASQLGGENFNI